MSALSVPVYTASRAKNNFGELLDAAQRKPVAIEKHGRPIAYVVSAKKMEAMEDWYLGARAVEVIKRGNFLGVKKTRKFFDSILHGT